MGNSPSLRDREYDKFDEILNGIVSIRHPQDKTHTGSHFHICDLLTLGSNSGQVWQLTATGSPYRTHMAFDFSTTLGGKIYLYENPTSSGGTIISGNNLNRLLGSTAPAVFKRDIVLSGTSISSGTILCSNVIGTSIAKSNTGDGTSYNNEFVLNYNTNYMYKFNSYSASNDVSLNIWYYTTC